MLIVCPSCATSYDLSAKALGAGRSVRCARCKTTWFATAEPAPEEATLVAAAAAAAADAPSAAPPGLPAFDEISEETAGAFLVDGVLPADESESAGDEAGGAVAMAEAPSIVPDDAQAPHESVELFDPGEPESVESLAALREKRAAERRRRRKSVRQVVLSLPFLIVALLAILVAVIQGRQTVVKHLPQTASLFAALGMPVNLRGFVFAGVKSTGEFHDGMAVLVVEGTIVNVTRQTLDVPRLRFAMRNGTGHEVYAWTAMPSRKLLGPGEALPFRSRLASPPPDGREVIVRFFNRRDMVAGAR